MKKRVIAVLLMLAFAVSLLYGCNLLRVNNERDMNQEIAAVGDEDHKDIILKKDLVSAYLSQGSTYVNNYGYTVSQAFEELLNQLINNRVIVQAATAALIEQNKDALVAKYGDGALKKSFYLSKDGDAKKSDNLLKLLDIVEPATEGVYGSGAKGRAESNVNKYYKEALDSYETEVKEDWASPAPSESPTPTPSASPTPRPTPKPSVEPSPSPVLPEPTPESGSEREEAHKRLKEALELQTITLEEFFEERMVAELENIIIEHYSEHLYNQFPISFAALQSKYNSMETIQKQQFSLDLTSYTTKLESAGADTYILYNPIEGYGYVKNLLIGFDENLTAKLTALQSKEMSTTQYLTKRAELLEDIVVKDLREVEETELVNYDSIGDFYNIITPDNAPLTKLLGGTYDNATKVFKNVDLTAEKLQGFVNYIFQYGTDPGMFNNEIDYLASPKAAAGTDEKYVTEFAEAARKVLEAGVGSYTLVGTDFGWHIVLCTDLITKGEGDVLVETDYDLLKQLLDGGTKYSDLPANLKATFTYKLYNAMRDTVANEFFTTTVQDIMDEYEEKSYIVRYEDAYKDLLNIK